VDRWGPSVDCTECGQTFGFCELDENGLCPDCSEEIENTINNDRDAFKEEIRLGD